MECLPCTREKLSTIWKILSLIAKGPFVWFPKALKPAPNPVMFGTPQLCGLVSVTGKFSSAFTFLIPASSWPIMLYSVVYPERNSFTLVGEKTRVLESMYCFELVNNVPPCRGNDGVTVFSSDQLKRPNHCEFALSLKSTRWLN